MKYAILFFLLAAILFGLAAYQAGIFYVALWPAFTFSVLAAGYAWLHVSIMGKRLDGTIAWWAIVLLLPYLLLTWSMWHVLRIIGREDCCNEIEPGLWLGRRPLAHEVPPGVDLVIDLTAEFFEPAGVVRGRTYVCLPVLDASIPELDTFEGAVARVSSWPGRALIHCASGHGRSAMLMAAVLVRKGSAASIEEALERIQKARPAIGLNKQQRQFLDLWLLQYVKESHADA
jgi:protein-tyrosine phosphatase